MRHVKSVSVGIGTLALGFVLLSWSHPGPSAAEAGAVGKYECAIIGSRGPQRFGTVFRLDSATGKGWQSIVRYRDVQVWTEVAETDGEAPEGGAGVGTFRLDAELISDNLGQETAIAIRVDTRTGKAWVMRSLPAPAKWSALRDASPEGAKPAAK